MLFKIIFITLFGIKIFVRTIIDRFNIQFLHNNRDVPEEFNGVVDEEKLVKISEYNSAKMKYDLIKELVECAFLIMFIFTPIFSYYFNWVNSFGIAYVFKALFFFWIFFAIDYLVTLPINYLYVFRVEQKFGFNKYSLGGWIIDQLKSILLTAIISFLVIVPIILFLKNNFNFSWSFVLLGTLFMSVLVFVFMYINPTVIVPLFYKLKPVEREDLKNKIEEIVKKAGFKLKGIYMANESKKSSHANAMFSGFGNSRSVIIFDNLLNNFSEDEILAVLGHEIGHGVYKHVLKFVSITIVEMFLFFLTVALLLSSHTMYASLGIEKNIYAGLFVIMILFFYVVGYFIQPFNSALSRRYEYQADAYSKKLLGSGEGLISAFKKFVVNELSVIEPHPLYEWFYYTHPSLIRRIRRLKGEREK